MQNLHAALKAANLNVQVTTAVSLQVLGVSSPPSSGAFSDSAAAIMGPITKFLADNQSPLMINVYPYFAHVSDPKNIRLDFALFNQKGDSMTDGDLKYTNLFDAMVDATYAALEKAGGATVGIVVSESGWPSAGNGDFTTIGNAQTYVNNLVAHVSSGMGTPKRPGKSVETYLFAIFNENLKPAGAEQNFGLYYPDMSEVYHVDFSSKE
ncbi:hypothetical protein L1049_019669 [Liquidambar formosana]|uniref:Beta-1,3-glucanase n=1 Tax=Liquidambar formosana TaxID=63359 RepID=A0AAP0S676_LIQFO